MPKLLISNLVYGEVYTDIFLNLHLKSLLENLSEKFFEKDSYYLIYTDGKNIKAIKSHINFHRLNQWMKVHFVIIENGLTYENRYNVQTIQLQNSVKFALDSNIDYMMIACADVYYGPDVFKLVFNILDENKYSSIWTAAFRATYETTKDILFEHCLSKSQLYDLVFQNIHPLWMHADWNSHRFTKIPYQMIWSNDSQLIMRGYSWTPIIFKPESWMLNASGCIDISFDPNIETIYWCQGWWEIPLVELGQLHHFYPPFGNKVAKVDDVVNWTRASIPQRNWNNLKRYWFFDKGKSDILASLMIKTSDLIVDEISVKLNM